MLLPANRSSSLLAVRRVPRARGLPFVGSAIEFSRDTLGFLQRQAALHGDLFRVKILGRDLHIVVHPDDIERVLVRDHAVMHKDLFTQDLSKILGNGLVTSEGEHWKKQRKLVSHAFTPAKIRGYADTMAEVAGEAARALSDGQVLDIHEEMTRLTLDVVAKTLFDADVRADARVVGEAMQVLSDFGASLEAGLLLPTWLPTPGSRRAGRAIARIDEVLYRIIAARRGSSGGGDDVLATLLRARDEQGGGMSDRELRDECVTLFLAGHETTAIALSFAFYLLSKHPEVEARLHAELERVLGGRSPTYADVEALELTARIVKETMRLLPPVWAIGRQLLEDLELRGFLLPKGSQLALCQWLVHHDARWFPDPEAFDPERWLEAGAKSLPRFAYFPFGGGPRQCIGNRFALTEAILILAMVTQRYRLDVAPGHPIALEPLITLRPRHGILVTSTERH